MVACGYRGGPCAEHGRWYLEVEAFVNVSTGPEGGSEGEAVLTRTWRKSSYSTGSDMTCVMFRHQGNRVLLRHSRQGPGGPVLAFTAEEWRAFIAGVKAGEFEV